MRGHRYRRPPFHELIGSRAAFSVRSRWNRQDGRPVGADSVGAGPRPERFGMTVAPDGAYVPWLDTPDSPVPVLLRWVGR
ncbi:hypothetical protein DBP12_10475 [Streptomyces sp. CS014]|nr:hypothetical protein DBP12_10475 [Streptomyces sp. CS014]